MELFESLGNHLSYEDVLQCDGAFAAAHINYGKSPEFVGDSSISLAQSSRRGSISSEDEVADVLATLRAFDGTESGLKRPDRLELWKSYWLEYVNAFDRLVVVLPRSVVTSYVGRHAIELGLKYNLLVLGYELPVSHKLDELIQRLREKCPSKARYMKWVPEFLESYSKFIEGRNVEYFRYPDYKGGKFFAGNRLDLEWLHYNFALVLLKLIHLAGLDDEAKAVHYKQESCL